MKTKAERSIMVFSSKRLARVSGQESDCLPERRRVKSYFLNGFFLRGREW